MILNIFKLKKINYFFIKNKMYHNHNKNEEENNVKPIISDNITRSTRNNN